MVRIETEQVVVDGVRSLVRIGGPEQTRDAAEAVVFLHGNPGSSEDWTHLMAKVGADARVIAPDMPGFGKAERPQDWPYTLEAYARHLNGILSSLRVTRAHLVLHDFGGPWGLTWASEHPTAVASITLFNFGIMRGYRWHAWARVWQTPVLGELSQLLANRWLFGKVLDRDNPKPFPREFVNRMYADADRGMQRAVLALYRNVRAVSEKSAALAARLTPHKFPALVVWGKDDRYVPARFAEQQGDVFAVDGVHVLDGCGHWPFIDDPERVDALVLPFLKRHLTRGR